MLGGTVDHFATFRFEDPAAGPKAHARSVRDFAAALHRGLELPDAQVEDPFGDEELSIFSITLGSALINVGVSMKAPSSDLFWDLQVQLQDPAFFKKARAAQLETLARVDQALHRQLLALGARDLRWFVQGKRGDPGQDAP